MPKSKKATAKKTTKKELKTAGKVVPVSKKAKAKAESAPVKKETAKKAVKAEKPAKAEKKSSAKANVGMYLHNGRLVRIEWTEETAKKVKANSEVHKDAPLFKDRIHKFDEKALKEYNKIIDDVEKLGAKAKTVLEKVGLHFAK